MTELVKHRIPWRKYIFLHTFSHMIIKNLFFLKVFVEIFFKVFFFKFGALKFIAHHANFWENVIIEYAILNLIVENILRNIDLMELYIDIGKNMKKGWQNYKQDIQV